MMTRWQYDCCLGSSAVALWLSLSCGCSATNSSGNGGKGGAAFGGSSGSSGSSGQNGSGAITESVQWIDGMCRKMEVVLLLARRLYAENSHD